MKPVIAGLAAVGLTAMLALIAEALTILIRWHLSEESRVPGMSLGINWVSVVFSIVRGRFLTPSGLTAAAVVFALAVMLFGHRNGLQGLPR